MSFLLDTDTCSAHLKRPAGLMHRFVQHSGGLSISTIVLARRLEYDRHEKEGPTMTKTLHGKVHGRTIELNEDPGVPEGQEVEIQMKVIPPPAPNKPTMTPGLAEIYAILGERFDTGETDIAERHNEHQP